MSSSNPSQPSSSPSLANPLVTSSSKSCPQVSTTQSSSNFSSEKLLPQFKPTSSKKTTKKKYQQWMSNPVWVKKELLPSSNLPKHLPLSPASSSSLLHHQYQVLQTLLLINSLQLLRLPRKGKIYKGGRIMHVLQKMTHYLCT